MNSLAWVIFTAAALFEVVGNAVIRHGLGRRNPMMVGLGMAALGLVPPEVPSPLNLFMNIPWNVDGTLGFAAPPRPVPGGYVRLRAEMDLVIAFSACPQDILPINGNAGKPVEAHFTVTGAIKS